MTDTFFGVPIHGDITQGSTRVDQKPIEELAPLFKALLDDKTIVEFGWTQYTPYFNDGDTCEFSVHVLWVRTTEESEGAVDEYGDEYEPGYGLDVDYHPSLGKSVRDWDPVERKFFNERYEGPDEARHDRCHALNNALQGGAFETVLLEKFGDHAMVTVQSDGIDVEFYSHD